MISAEYKTQRVIKKEDGCFQNLLKKVFEVKQMVDKGVEGVVALACYSDNVQSFNAQRNEAYWNG